ncbi:type II toxin-antitoxin system RelE/ParE family toxin (plasmid) [Verrucomicrobiaceae bacterium 227]
MEEYQIVFSPTALEDLDSTLAWLAKEAPEKVTEWYQSIKTHINTLKYLPEAHPLAPENGLWGTAELRQLLFKAYPSKYRILYTVKDDTVQILSIRHGARRFLHED